MNKWLKKYGWVTLAVIFALIIVPGLVQLLMTKVFTTTNGGSNDGWLGFWGGYLGATIAIVGVYWQATRQSKLSQKQLDNEKENQYRQARPFFILTREKGPDKEENSGKPFYCYINEEGYSNGENCTDYSHYLVINNVSNKDMYAVKVIVTNDLASCSDTDQNFISEFENFKSANVLTKNTDYEKAISIGQISSKEKVYLKFPNTQSINQIWIWYITEIRESVKLYFYHDPNDKNKENEDWIKYQPEHKRLENQQTAKINPALYELKDFKESKKVNIMFTKNGMKEKLSGFLKSVTQYMKK